MLRRYNFVSHKTFSRHRTAQWANCMNHSSRVVKLNEWGIVRDILVFIMCHMQFENGSLGRGGGIERTIEYAILLWDCHLKRKKRLLVQENALVRFIAVIGRCAFAVISNSSIMKFALIIQLDLSRARLSHSLSTITAFSSSAIIYLNLIINESNATAFFPTAHAIVHRMQMLSRESLLNELQKCATNDYN